MVHWWESASLGGNVSLPSDVGRLPSAHSMSRHSAVRWRQFNSVNGLCPSVGEYISELWYIQTVEY